MASLQTLAATVLTSAGLRGARRAMASLPRRLTGRTPVIQYFHDPADPYSRLTLQVLPALAATYRVQIKGWRVAPPDEAAAPERERLAGWSERDAALVAQARGLVWPAPDGAEAFSEDGTALRAKLGHYLGATFFYEGEWYWGVDRLHFLENRLIAAGLRRPGRTAMVAPLLDMTGEGGVPQPGAPRPVLHFFGSLRSPYTYIAAARARHLAEAFGAELRLRPVLPMVMRGLPVPREKRFYIMLDTKREAERLGMAFGKIADPVGPGAERGLAVLHHAIDAGKGSALIESFLSAVWAEGIDAATDEGLATIADRAGVSEVEVAAALADPSWRARVEANREEMFGRGLWGVPSFRVNEGTMHWGQDRLWAVENDLRAALAPATAT